MTHIPLAAGAEFDRIRAIARTLGARAGTLGDDCAWIEQGGGWLAMSTDVSVEGVHFRRDWLSLEEIGWRAATSALSDLAAGGAMALGALIAVTQPGGDAPGALTALMDGAGSAVAASGGKVLGGDLSRGDSLSLAVTVIGHAEAPLGRVGARPGDTLWVTGRLGGARAALLAWLGGRTPDPDARDRFAKPHPRLAEGRALRRAGARAMLDLSDGLGGDAGHLAAASGVGIILELDRLPLDSSVAGEAARQRIAPALLGAQGGEDYELLVAMPDGFQGLQDVPLTRIGSVVEGEGVRHLLSGEEVEVPGFDHFAP